MEKSCKKKQVSNSPAFLHSVTCNEMGEKLLDVSIPGRLVSSTVGDDFNIWAS